MQPRRLATEDPVERIAAGCGAFVGEALSNPAWGALVARGPLSMPNVALSARGRLTEDLGRAAASGRLGDVTPELAFEFAIGIVLQAMQAAAEGRFVRSQAPGVVAGILRAIGVKPKEAQEIALRVGASNRRIRDEPLRHPTNSGSIRGKELHGRHLVRFTLNGGPRWGVAQANGVAPLAGDYPTTAALIERGEDDWRAAAGQTPSIGLEAIELLSPVTTPCRVFCQGANYRRHMIESGLDPDAKAFNMFFMKSDASISPAIGSVRPPGHVKLLFREPDAADHSSPPDPLRSLPAGARVCRPGFPPGRTMRLAKAHVSPAKSRVPP